MAKLTSACFFALSFALMTIAFEDRPLLAQPITPAADGTGTQVNTVGDRFDIIGGTQAGSNLFHSFDQFNVPTGNTANFVGTPNLANILGRVTGGSPSLIDGLLQVSNSNANLFLMNPAGMIFGANASLNLPGSFTATTATGIGFGEGTFNAFGPNNFSSLISAPTHFSFATETGLIVNSGDLAVANGQNLRLVGGSVLNVGTLEAPGGNITLAAIPEKRQIQISQEG
ncbi:MAG: filamentous hemagglutinin N-terminal domain-containing protein, partial [Prochlorotrichaceae cyanobacterium]